MKILHVYKTYLPDDFTGVPRVIHALAEGMAPFGVETSVLTVGSQNEGACISVGAHKVYIARRNFEIASTDISASAFRLFRRLVRDADVVNYHFPWPFADLLHFSVRYPASRVVTYHSDIVRQRYLSKLYSPMQHAFLSSLDSIVATSPNYLESSQILQKFREKTTLIPIGIPDENVSEHVVDVWKNRVGDNFFLFLGALRYYKGLPFLVEAARQTGLPLVIAGGGDTSILGQDVPDNVTVLGEVEEPDKLALLQLCQAFVFPSHLRSEAFGISLLEAARAGKALISTEIGTGTSFINLDGKTGVVVPPANSEALADAMQRLFRDPDLSRQMGRNSRARYLESFQQGQMVQKYLDLYQRLRSAER